MSIIAPYVALCVVVLCFSILSINGDIKRCTLYGVYLSASDMWYPISIIEVNMSEARKYTVYVMQRFWNTKTKQRGNTIFGRVILGRTGKNSAKNELRYY